MLHNRYGGSPVSQYASCGAEASAANLVSAWLLPSDAPTCAKCLLQRACPAEHQMDQQDELLQLCLLVSGTSAQQHVVLTSPH